MSDGLSIVYKPSLRRRRLIRFLLGFHFSRLNKPSSFGLTKVPADHNSPPLNCLVIIDTALVLEDKIGWFIPDVALQ